MGACVFSIAAAPCCCKGERGGCFCCCKKEKPGDSKVVPAAVKRAHSAAFADAKLARTFRPEKFKIMLAFLQIFSQMNSNYGVNWPDVTADYMRWLSAVNIDIVRLAALDCLFRSDFYFFADPHCDHAVCRSERTWGLHDGRKGALHASTAEESAAVRPNGKKP